MACPEILKEQAEPISDVNSCTREIKENEDVPEVQKIRNSEVEKVSQTEVQALNSFNVNQESKLPKQIQTKSAEPMDLSAIHLSISKHLLQGKLDVSLASPDCVD